MWEEQHASPLLDMGSDDVPYAGAPDGTIDSQRDYGWWGWNCDALRARRMG
jgi:hypothetical protein